MIRFLALAVLFYSGAAFGYTPAAMPTNTALQGAATLTYPGGLWRDTFGNGNGAPPLYYMPSNAACSLNAGAGDNGSQVRSADGKCWIAVFPANGAEVAQWGADLTGATDATTALNACLATAGIAGVPCYIGNPNKQVLLKLLGNVSIPQGATLDCGWTFAGVDEVPAHYAQLPALMLDSAHTITVTGDAAALRNCLIYRNGMTFPPANPSAYAGLAVSAPAAAAGFSITDTVILGFDSALLLANERPYMRHVYLDGTGVTHAVLEVDNGNSDSGYFSDIKIGPFATSNPNCAATLRAGTGLRMNGINFIDTTVVQNFQVAQFDFGSFVLAGTLWSDFASHILGCAAGSSVGFLINTGGVVHANELNVNGTQIGIKAIGGNGAATNIINRVFLNGIFGDCIDVGGTGVSGGKNYFSNITTNSGPPNCGGNVIKYADTTQTSWIRVDNATLYNSGGALPYFNPNGLANAQLFMVSDKIIADLVNATTILGAATLSGCTGIGTGTCTFINSTRTTPWSGTIQLNTAGTPGTTGAVILNFPSGQNVVYYAACQATFNQGSTAWPSTATVTVASLSSTQSEFFWTSGTALSAGQTYDITYNCFPQ